MWKVITHQEVLHKSSPSANGKKELMLRRWTTSFKAFTLVLLEHTSHRNTWTIDYNI